MTTYPTIMPSGALGNSAGKSAEQQLFRNGNHYILLYGNIIRLIYLFGTKMPQVQVLSPRPTSICTVDTMSAVHFFHSYHVFWNTIEFYYVFDCYVISALISRALFIIYILFTKFMIRWFISDTENQFDFLELFSPPCTSY